jgi:hypothetical protein
MEIVRSVGIGMAYGRTVCSQVRKNKANQCEDFIDSEIN